MSGSFNRENNIIRETSINNPDQCNAEKNCKKPKNPNPFLFNNLIQDENVNPFLQPHFPASPVLQQGDADRLNSAFKKHEVLPPLMASNDSEYNINYHKNDSNQQTSNSEQQISDNCPSCNAQNETHISNIFPRLPPICEKRNKPFIRNNYYFKRMPLELFKGKTAERQADKCPNTPKPSTNYVAKKCRYRPSYKLPPMEEDLYISKSSESSIHSNDQSSENLELDEDDN